MSAATERIPVLVTPEEKARISTQAKRARISMGELLRRAARNAETPSLSAEDEALLEGLLGRLVESTTCANMAVDDAMAFVKASNARIAAMEKKAAIARKAA